MPVGLVYSPHYLEHDDPLHVENALRLQEAVRVLQESGAWDEAIPIDPHPVSSELLGRLHSPAYVEEVRRVAEAGGGWLDMDTYICPASYRVALLAAGGLVQAVEAVLQGQVEGALALVRPPGHHACPARGMGFCLFNNVALGALYALEQRGLERVLIVDWDVHHGNGTQEAFFRDGRVLFFSVHQYPYYPGTGAVQEIGEGSGRGCIVNVPLPAGVGDAGYIHVFEQVLLPVAQRFEPQLILVSAGFDAHWADPLASMQLSVGGYAQLAATLRRLAEEFCPGRLVLTLEGGYHPEALGYGVLATCRVWQGHEPTEVQDPLGPSQHGRPANDPILRNVIATVRDIHGL